MSLLNFFFYSMNAPISDVNSHFGQFLCYAAIFAAAAAFVAHDVPYSSCTAELRVWKELL